MAAQDAFTGYLAVLGAIGCFGSFGVPIKSRSVLAAQADPLIYQLYKSIACFGSSLSILLFKDFTWTWWAMVGATMWVCTGTLAIYAIQKAGLGLAQTTYSCLTVFVSFLWGVAAFHEAGSSVGMSLLGLSLIALGLAGLGHATQAAPRATLQRVPSAESTNFFMDSEPEAEPQRGGGGSGSNGAAADDAGTAAGRGKGGSEPPPGPPPKPAGELGNKKGKNGSSGSFPELQVRIGAQLHHRSTSGGDLANGGGGGGGGGEDDNLQGASPTSSCCAKDLEAARLLGPPSELRIILRQNWVALHTRVYALWHSGAGRGVLAAVLIGLLNGSFLVPYKLARRHDQAQGIEYVVPFSAASLLVTLLACGLYYGLLTGQHPSLHVRAVAGPALLTGVLWSLGNLCSIWAVQHLGLSVGFPLVQCQLIVSTAWAVLYYREVPAGSRSLWMFVGSTLVVVAGMMLLAAYGS